MSREPDSRPQDTGGRDGPPGWRMVSPVVMVVNELELALELTPDKAGCSCGCDRQSEEKGEEGNGVGLDEWVHQEWTEEQ